MLHLLQYHEERELGNLSSWTIYQWITRF